MSVKRMLVRFLPRCSTCRSQSKPSIATYSKRWCAPVGLIASLPAMNAPRSPPRAVSASGGGDAPCFVFRPWKNSSASTAAGSLITQALTSAPQISPPFCQIVEA
jgi:hypothetical protein